MRLKPNAGATFLVPGGGEVQLYGNLDVSFDETTKGLKSDYGDNGGVPVGKMGWQPAIASNLSNLGVRGHHPMQPDLNFIWQLEAGIDISATPGIKETTSNTSYTVNGALFSRNSFVGFNGKDWGAVMIGKSETPYKTSTDRLNPFSGMLGDYRVISAIRAATTASNSACALRTRSGTSRPTGAALRSRPCTRRAEPRRHQQHRAFVGAGLRGRQHSRKRRAASDLQRRLVRRPVQSERRLSAGSAIPDRGLREAQERQSQQRPRQSRPARCRRRERVQGRRPIHVRHQDDGERALGEDQAVKLPSDLETQNERERPTRPGWR